MTGEQKVTFQDTEGGTEIGSHDIAVVVSPDGAWQIFLPHDEGAQLPEGAVALIAAAMRLTNDPEFYREMIAWHERQTGGLNQEEREGPH